MKKIVVASARAASVTSANLLGTIVNYAIWTFAFIIALSELGIAAQFMQILFTGLIAMLAIAGGLAFGLGGKEAASRTVEKCPRDVFQDVIEYIFYILSKSPHRGFWW